MVLHIPGPAGRLEALVDNPAALCTTAFVPEGAEPDPALPPRAAVVLAHPHPLYGGSMHTKVLFQVAKAFCRLNCAVLRFNFRGVGTSEGNVRERPRRGGGLLGGAGVHGAALSGCRDVAGGVSFGSWVGTTAGANDYRVTRLIAIAPPVTMYDFSSVARSTKPKFFINGEHDEICPVQRAAQVLRARGGTKRPGGGRGGESPLRRPRQRGDGGGRGSHGRIWH